MCKIEEVEIEEEKYEANRFTLSKMRSFIMQMKLCREDKNCGECTMVDFCAIWRNQWTDIEEQQFNGMTLEIYAGRHVQDLPVLAIDRIADAVDNAFNELIHYVNLNGLYFSDDYTTLKKREPVE